MKRRHILGIAYLVIVIAGGCASLDPISPTAVKTGSADFTRFVVVGDALTAGTQSGSLVSTFQGTGFAALLAAAARAPQFEMPLISEPGIPPRLVFGSIVPTIDIDTLPGIGAPTNATFAGIYNNLGIPGARLHDLLIQRPIPGPNPFYEIVLRDSTLFGPTAISQAVNAQPTFLVAWVGATDVFASASVGTDALLTPLASFEADYQLMMNTLKPASGAIVAGNIPNILTFPLFATIPPVLVDPVTRQPVLDTSGNLIPLIGEFQGTSGELPLSSLLTLPASSLLAQGMGIPVAYGGTGAPLPDAVVLDPTEINTIDMHVAGYNTVIDTVCSNRNIAVVDLLSLFNGLAENGVVIRGETFTTDYVTGGLFGVDGYHPSSMGYDTVAQEFIRVINTTFGAAIPAPPLPAEPTQ